MRTTRSPAWPRQGWPTESEGGSSVRLAPRFGAVQSRVRSTPRGERTSRPVSRAMQGGETEALAQRGVVSRAIQTVWVTRERRRNGDNRPVPVPESSLSSAQRQERRVRRDAVGEALRRARLSSGLSQDGLAKLSGVSRAAIARIETGEASTQVDRLWDLAAALNTTPSAILAQAEGML